MFTLLQIPVSFYSFNLDEIIGLSSLFVTFFIQMIFYLAYYRKPLATARKNKGVILSSLPKVSVIIESENESENLAILLPLILEQDYPDFEVIVVNNGSTDESDILLEKMKLQYPALYSTFVPHSQDSKLGFRKLALTLGIKAAKGDIILVIEPYCRPQSEKWIASMVSCMGDNKDVVLGYSYYLKEKEFYNRVARFDNMLFSLQYLSVAIKGKPYTGVYRNVAFRKKIFFENKGFAKYLYLENGEDVFINQIVTPSNTVVCLNQDGFTESIIDSFSLWRKIKKSYSVAKCCFRGSMTRLFSLEYISRYIFYILFIAIIIQSCHACHWGTTIIAGLFFLIRLVVQLFVLGKSSGYFKSGKLLFSLPLLDILQPIYNMRFKTKPPRRIH